MDPIEAWLARSIPATGPADSAERLRQERFVAARTIAAMIALAGLPPYLVYNAAPSTLDCLATAALVTPILAVMVLSRTGRLDLAQAIASAALTPFAAAIGAAAGGAWALLAMVAVPLEALFCGSPRAVKAAVGLGALGVPLSAWMAEAAAGSGSQAVAVTAIAVAGIYALGHALAQRLADVRATSLLGAAVRAGEAQGSAGLRCLDELIAWHDRDGSVLRTNGAGKLLGAPPGALFGRGLFARIHLGDRPVFLKAVSDAAAGAPSVVARFRLLAGEELEGAGGHKHRSRRERARAEWRVIWVEMRAHRLQSDASGAAVISVIRNISEHKRQLEELEASRLAHIKSNAERMRLLATVSHELRTPLNAIVGFSEALLGAAAAARPEQRQDYARIIRDSGRHLLELVESLLDLAKIEAGSMTLQPEPLDLGELVEDCCKLLAIAADEAAVVTVRDVAPDLPRLVADRRACRQILINLLSNAIKFTPRGGLVTVTCRAEADRLLLSVADTGVGITEADLPRLGDPFFQATNTAATRAGGSGLGLSLVRGLVGLHHGRMTIASATGRGTCVTLSFPLDSPAAAPGASPPSVPLLSRPRQAAAILETG